MKNKNNPNKQSYILTKETLGMTILLFCALVLLMLLTNNLVFGPIGAAICTFMYGTFGYGSFVAVALLAYLGQWLVFEKKIKMNLKTAAVTGATLFFAFLLFHSVSTRDFSLESYGEYLSKCYLNAELGFSGYTFGGVISAIIVYPVAKGTTFIGAYVIFSILLLLCGYVTYVAARNFYLNKTVSASVSSKKRNKEKDVEKIVSQPRDNETPDELYTVNEDYEIVNTSRRAPTPPAPAQAEEKPEEDDRFSAKNLGRKILFENGEFAAESYRRNMIFNENSYFNHPVVSESDYLSGFGSSSSPAPQNKTYSSEFSDSIEERNEQTGAPSYIYGDKPVESLEEYDTVEDTVYNVTDNEEPDETERNYSSAIREQSAPEYSEPEPASRDVSPRAADPYSLDDEDKAPEEVALSPDDPVPDDLDAVLGRRAEERKEEEPEPEESNPNSIFNLFNSSNTRLTDNGVNPDQSRVSSRRQTNSELFDDNSDEISLNVRGLRNESETRQTGFTESRREEAPRTEREIPAPPARAAAPKPVEKPVEEKAPEPEKPKHVWKKYVRPSLDLLDDYPENNNVNTAEIEDSKQIIVETLANFKIASQINNVIVGPAITRYDVVIEDRTNIKNALKYRDAVAMALMKENVNAYLNYSKGAISIEVPNSSRTVVGLKGMLASSQFINCKQNTLTFALGKNVEGKVVCPDITKMPHLLVAGTTGSGKSICLSSLIVSLLYKYGPEELRFILVDPKQVEFIPYDKLPHLMINEIIYDVDKAIKALNWAIKEMERRYQLFKEMTEKGVATKNLTEYNAHLPEGEEKLPKIVIILDEFGDLMLQAKKDIESRIIRLVQKARACGIHLILATQRPSVDCITGLIKSNLPTRIGFKVNSFDDARTIFDIGGAEKLLGKGDLYFRSAESPDLARIQGCFIDTHEVQRVTDFVKHNNETYFDQSISDFINTVEEPETDDAGGGDGLGDTETKIDDTFIKALHYCVTSNQASVSMIQRRFPVGYIKACKIIDWMENMNYVTQSEGSKPRKVLLSKEEFIRTYGEVDD